MLDKLRIEFTRSRPRHSNDNGLAETKNGAVVRKLFGYAHIPQRHAARFNTFCGEYLNPFLNFHRPCLFATDKPDPNKPGRIKRVYRPKDAMTPLDKLASLPEAATFLREGITLEDLRAGTRAHRCAGGRGTQPGAPGAVQTGSRHAPAEPAARWGWAVDMWTMRWRAPARPVDNACALPTARAFAHMPTALDEHRRTSKPRPQYTGRVYNGSTRFASPISGRSRLIPRLENANHRIQWPLQTSN